MERRQARGSETVCRMEPSPAQRAARDRIAAEIAATAGYALPGTLTVRSYACGKPNCRCHADPPRLHGPYAEWTRKIGGKTVTRRLTQAERVIGQLARRPQQVLRAFLPARPGRRDHVPGERSRRRRHRRRLPPPDIGGNPSIRY